MVLHSADNGFRSNALEFETATFGCCAAFVRTAVSPALLLGLLLPYAASTVDSEAENAARNRQEGENLRTDGTAERKGACSGRRRVTGEVDGERNLNNSIAGELDAR